ncbi:MAG TPA: CmcJ/NvfI family oxidoreductase [Candidatus Binataceae bacterium]|nr:CmcJ/NvfI family oxidoreductase [Candidatus Binataceae bacterium]
METETMQTPKQVTTAMNYLADPEVKPVSYMYKPPEGTPVRSWHISKHPTTIHNGRLIVDRMSLDRQGFVLIHNHSSVGNFYDDDQVRSVYYPEVESLVKKATGAVRLLAFDHNVRCGPMAKRGDTGVREPVKYAHNDYTLKSGPQRVRDLLPGEAEALLKNRFAVINVWRPIRGPVEDMPLAVCDAGSIAPQDLVATDLVYPDRTGEVHSLAFNAAHRWYYFPHMQADELILLKCYDSAEDGRARFTAHGAFEDPTTPAGAPARESIEVRTLVFFAPQT